MQQLLAEGLLMRPSRLAGVERVFWDHLREGMSSRDAGVAVGVSVDSGSRWFADAGGVRPRFSDGSARRNWSRLTLDERNEIHDGVARGEGIREMARRLDRAPSTIMPEIERNAVCRGRYRARYQFGAQWHGGWDPQPRYRASMANARAHERARRPKPG